MSAPEPKLPEKTIQDVLKDSYFWQQFADDEKFISAIHHYYTVVQECYSEEFYNDALNNLLSESKRVQHYQSEDCKNPTLVPATMLLGLIAKAAVNDRNHYTVTFPDGKTGDQLYREYVERTVLNATEADKAVPRRTEIIHPGQIIKGGMWAR